jgi:tellurite resistance protein
MPNPDLRHPATPTPVEITDPDRGDRDDEALDAVLTAGALIARADNWIQPVERYRLLAFIERRRLVPRVRAADIFEAFWDRIHELREPGGAQAALRRLARQAGRPPAQLAITAAEEVAAADGHLDPREDHVLRMLRIALRAPLPSSAAEEDRAESA